MQCCRAQRCSKYFPFRRVHTISSFRLGICSQIILNLKIDDFHLLERSPDDVNWISCTHTHTQNNEMFSRLFRFEMMPKKSEQKIKKPITTLQGSRVSSWRDREFRNSNEIPDASQPASQQRKNRIKLQWCPHLLPGQRRKKIKRKKQTKCDWDWVWVLGRLRVLSNYTTKTAWRMACSASITLFINHCVWMEHLLDSSPTIFNKKEKQSDEMVWTWDSSMRLFDARLHRAF